LGVRLHEEATQLLKEVGNESLYAVKRELEKLAAYVPSDRTVQSADVEALRGTESGASVFDLMNAIGAHDHGRALRILARNLENGEAPLRILGALVWQYRRLWKMKEQIKSGGREGRSGQDVTDGPLTGAWVSGAISDAQLTQAFQLVFGNRLEAQRREWEQPPVRVMEDLLFRLCGQPSKPASSVERMHRYHRPRARRVRDRCRMSERLRGSGDCVHTHGEPGHAARGRVGLQDTFGDRFAQG
jgi:DNA polymerase-3 subunit delta